MCNRFSYVAINSESLLLENKKMSKIPDRVRKRLKKEARVWDLARRKEKPARVEKLLDEAEIFAAPRPARQPVEDGCMKSIGLKVSKRGYIVLPASIRRQMNIKSGTKILLSKEENRLILQPVVSFTDRLSGLTAQKFGKTAADVQKYIDEERKDRSK